jgi:isocitrate dehydrogenase kinase/phosphatase
MSNTPLIDSAATAISTGFDLYQNQFQAITELARIRFERRHWHGMRADAAERLDLYKRFVDQTIVQIRELLRERVQEKELWRGMREVYLSQVEARKDRELAETFFNSITRRIFSTVGVNPNIEFVYTDQDAPSSKAYRLVTRAYLSTSTIELAEKLLNDYMFDAKYEDLVRDTRWIAMELDPLWSQDLPVEMCKAVFYRDKRAYIIGALNTARASFPCACFDKFAARDCSGCVLTDENEVSILFSFARSHLRSNRSSK